MKVVEMLAVGLRLMGVYLVYSVFHTLLTRFSYWSAMQAQFEGQSYWMISLIIVEALIFVAIAFLLLRFPVTVARWLLGRQAGAEAVLQGKLNDLQTVLFCVVGVYVLSQSLPYLAESLLWLPGDGGDSREGLWFPRVIPVLVGLLQTALGLYLTLQAKGLSRLLSRLRG